MKILMIAGLAAVLALSAGANTISVSFDNNTTPIGMQADDWAGAPDVRTTNWNNWARDVSTVGDNEAVVDSGGTVVPGIAMTISATGGWTSRDNNHDNDQEMFSDVNDVYGSGRTINVSSIPYAAYDVYVYMRDDGDNRAGLFAIGSVTNYVRGVDWTAIPLSDGSGYILSTDTTYGAGTDIDQGNYVVFQDVTGSSFSLFMNAVYAGNATWRNKVAGFQIVDAGLPLELYFGFTPVHGSTGVDVSSTIQVVVTNGTLDVDAGSFAMALVADGVTNDVTSSLVIATPSAGVTTFSYSPVPSLAYGTDYTVQYQVAGIGGETNAYGFSFSTAEDIFFSTSPADGADPVATDAQIVVYATNGAVNLSSALDGYSMKLVSGGTTNDVTGSVTVSNPTSNVTAFSYDASLAYSTEYTVEFELYHSGGYTSTVEFSFSSAYDPSVYLIAPGIRNGGFEYINGTNDPSNTTWYDYGDWVFIDNWVRLTSGKEAIEFDANAPQGVRYHGTDRNSRIVNLTDHVVQAGDVFDYSFICYGRSAGAIAQLCYSNAVVGVTNIADSAVTIADGLGTGTIEASGSFVFPAGHPAIGSTLGLMILDNENALNNSTTWAHVDKVRLRYGNIALQSVFPADGATDADSGDPIEVVIAEGESQVDAGSLVLMLDGVDVTTNAVVDDTASSVTITYTPPVPLTVGAHAASISAIGTPAGSVEKSWAFLVFAPAYAGDAQYNINFQNGGAAVADGTVIIAPSEGSNMWNNLVSPSGSTWNPSLPVTIVDANGEHPIGLDWYGFTQDFSYTTANGIVDPLYQGYFGKGNFNGTLDITGLSTNATYDIVVYFTWGWSEDSATYTITEGSGAVTNLSLDPVRANCGSGAYSNIVEGANYVIFTDLVASAAGSIDINAQSANGGFSGLQIVQYGFGVPTVEPVIEYISVSGNTVTLSWTAETIGTYSIERATSLAPANWTPVATGLPAGNQTTNVTVGGSSQEFYKIKGE